MAMRVGLNTLFAGDAATHFHTFEVPDLIHHFPWHPTRYRPATPLNCAGIWWELWPTPTVEGGGEEGRCSSARLRGRGRLLEIAEAGHSWIWIITTSSCVGGLLKFERRLSKILNFSGIKDSAVLEGTFFRTDGLGRGLGGWGNKMRPRGPKGNGR